MKACLSSLFFFVAFVAFGGSAQADLVTFVFDMDGTQEVPGPGDPDGFGTAVLTIDDVNLTVDWEFTVDNIDLPLTGAHIHNAPFGVAGPVVVNFNSQLSGTGLFDPDLAAVLADPPSFYVNLHNAAFPAGAIRGQFGSPIPEPGSTMLVACFIALLAAGIRKR